MKKTVKLIAASLLLSCTLLWGQASDFSDEALFGSSDDDFFFDDGIEELKTPENGDGLTASHGELFENGSVKIGGSLMSEYQLNQYFRADHGRLELTETQTVNTELRASVFSEGTTVIIIGAVILVSAIAGCAIYYNIKKTGARSK